VDAGVTIDENPAVAKPRARRVTAGHTPEEKALLSFLDRYFPERRRRSVRRNRERREDLRAA
jgi:hypothetical protein